jgi:hypothetical protein
MPQIDRAQLDQLLARSRAPLEQSQEHMQQLASALGEAEEQVSGTPSTVVRHSQTVGLRSAPDVLPALPDDERPWP